MKKLNILISAAGTATSWHLVNTIKSLFNDSFKIFLCDINPRYLIPAFTLAEEFIQVPKIDDALYYPAMLETMQAKNIDIFIPLIDMDLSLFCNDNNALLDIGVFSTAPKKNVMSIADNKQKLNNYLMLNNLPVPKEFTFLEVENDIEYIVKPVKGFGSKGVYSISGSKLKESSTCWSNNIVQEKCLFPEVTAEVFNNLGNLSVIVRERIETKAGVCTKARIFQDDKIISIINSINDVLPLPVASCIQFMKSSITDEWLITDVNLRMGAGTSLSSAVGWNLAAASLCLWGNLVQSPNDFLKLPNQDKYVVRVYQDIVTK